MSRTTKKKCRRIEWKRVVMDTLLCLSYYSSFLFCILAKCFHLCWSLSTGSSWRFLIHHSSKRDWSWRDQEEKMEEWCVCVCVCHRSQVSHLESSLGKSCFLLRTQICVRIVEQGCVSITPRKWLRKKHIISVVVKIYSAYKLLVVYSQVGNYGQNDN